MRVQQYTPVPVPPAYVVYAYLLPILSSGSDS